MNRTKAVIMAHYWDNRKPLLIFWTIVLAVSALQYILNRSFEGEAVNGTFSAVIIYFLVTGMLTVRATMYLTLSFGGTRKEYAKGTILFYLLFSAFNSLIMAVLGSIETQWLNNGHTRFLFSMMDLTAARADLVWLIQTLVLFNVVLFFVMLSGLHLRFGIPPYITGLVVVAANLSIPAARAIWRDIAFSFYRVENLTGLIVGFFAAGIVFSLLAWILLSRVSVKTSKA